MRQLLFLLLSLAALGLAAPREAGAQSGDAASELFLNAYMAVQQGEKLEHDGSMKQALSKYRYAASLLDQISAKYPDWQRLILEYRKKRTSENIARVQGQVASGDNAAPAAASRNAINDDAPLPTREDPGAAVAFPGASGSAASAGGDDVDAYTSQIKNKIQQLQNELRGTKDQLQNAISEKEEMATRLDSTIKQLDKLKVGDAELKQQLRSVTEAFKNATSDSNKDLEGRKMMQAQIAQLEAALQKERTEREAAEQEGEDSARRAAKLRKNADSLAKERDAANQKAVDLSTKFSDAAKLATQLEEAQKQVAKLSEDNAAAEQSKNDIAAKLADTQKQMQALAQQRDSAQKEVETLSGKVTEAQNQVVSVKVERDQIARERDAALAQLDKAKDAQKQVDKLLADNASLMQKLGDAEKTIQEFNAEMPKKDEQIASLKKEVGDTKDLLAAAQRQNAEFQGTMNDLQQQLDTASSELAEMKSSGASTAEKRKFTEENDLLRGIVLRQLKEQARRTQAKKLAIQELQKLEVQSDVLMKQIGYLGEPVVKLTENEKALFKAPQIEIADTDSSAMEFSIAAPKKEGSSDPNSAGSKAAPAPQKETSQPRKTAAAGTDAPLPERRSEAGGPASAPVTEVTSLTSPDSLWNTPALSPAGSADKPSDSTKNSSSPTGSGSDSQGAPGVPPDMLPQARDAKEQFERGQYREAEKTYEKMLSKVPNNVYVLSNLGVVRFREGKMKLAEEAFKKAIAVAPQDTFSHCTLGIIYYSQNKFDDAVNALTKAISINPKYAVAHNYLGITASQKGWQEAAMKELETAIALDPNYADANFNLAVIYATQQPSNKEEAQKHYKRATDLGAEPDAALEQLIK